MKNKRFCMNNMLLVCWLLMGMAVQAGQDLNEALIIAVKRHSYDEVQKLIQAGADVNKKTTYYTSEGDMDRDVPCTVLEYAIRYGYVDIAKELIQAKPALDDMNKAIVCAAEHGEVDILRELLQADDTPLSMLSHPWCLFVTSETCNMCAKQKHLNKALIRAARRGYVQVTNELIKAGAHVNHTDEYGDTALTAIFCCQKSRGVAIIQALLAAKANVNHADTSGDTALIKAIQEHDFDAVQVLLKAPGININHANNDGNTALIEAIKSVQYTYIAGNKRQYNDCSNSQKIVEALVKTPGINPHHVNKYGETAIKLLEEVQSRVNRYG